MADRPAAWSIIYVLLSELKMYYLIQKGRLLKSVLSQLILLQSKYSDEGLLRVIVVGPAHCHSLLKSPCL